MDFDIGNILYVVITLVAIIASLLGKKKKPGTKESKPGFLENLEKALNMGQEDPAVVDLQDYEPDLEEDERPDPVFYEEASEQSKQAPTLMEEYEKMMADRQASGYASMHFDGEEVSEPLEVINLEEEGGTDYFEIVKDFDAGTAVVYSAIINRVEY